MNVSEQKGVERRPWKAVPYQTVSEEWMVKASGGLTPIASSLDRKTAFLISAAHEMKEALRYLLNIVCTDCSSEYRELGKCTGCPRVKMAKAALAKAEGEEIENERREES